MILVAMEYEIYLEKFNEVLRYKGLELTTKRSLIFEKLIEIESFKNADLLWIELKRDNKVSRATIYTTLHLLCEAGVLEKYYNNSNAASYRLRFS
jgi:Fe2+ or Zn2+ uptake regulation protein